MSDSMNIQEEISKCKNKKNFERCLDFKLANVEYGIDIDYIQEIRPYVDADILPIYAPQFILGIGDFDNKLVPVYNFDIFLNFLEGNSEIAHKIILILEIENEQVGLLIDEIKGIINFASNNLLHSDENKQAPKFMIDYIQNTISIDGRNIFILDLEKLFINNQFLLDKISEMRGEYV